MSGLRSAPGQSWEAAPVGGHGLAPPDPATSPGWPLAAPPLHQGTLPVAAAPTHPFLCSAWGGGPVSAGLGKRWKHMWVRLGLWRPPGEPDEGGWG